MNTPSLEWPHNSEITVDTSQTTTENYILITKSILVGEVLYLKRVCILGSHDPYICSAAPPVL